MILNTGECTEEKAEFAKARPESMFYEIKDSNINGSNVVLAIWFNIEQYSC